MIYTSAIPAKSSMAIFTRIYISFKTIRAEPFARLRSYCCCYASDENEGIYLSKPPKGYRCEGPAARPIRQALEEASRDVRNALSQVDADSKDHEQDRQTDAAYPVSSFRESVQRTLCTLFCLFQLGCPCISRESGTNQKYQTDPDLHKHFSKWDITILRPRRAGSQQGQRHPC